MPTSPAPTSHDEPSTPAHDASSDDQDHASTTTSTTSWTRALQDVDLERLSPRSKAIRILIGDRIPEGYNLTELATELGRTPSWVSERLSELRNELLLQTGLFFPLTDHEYGALRDSIATYGVRTPVIIGQHLPLVDGRHRLLIAQELDLDDVPSIWLDGLDPDQERELAVALNAARRQLTRAQRRKLVEAELMRDPARSDRHIAAVCGVVHSTVGLIRAEIAQQQRLEHQMRAGAQSTTPRGKVDESPTPPAYPEKRVGRDGKAQTIPPRPPAAEQPERPLGHVECVHGHRHALYRDGAGYRLEAV